MNKGDIGRYYFTEKGTMCSQAVLLAFKDECKITEEMALKLGSNFASGMGYGKTCGACTGALMVIGLIYGQDKFFDNETRLNAKRISSKFLTRFKEYNGSTTCNTLLGYDLTTEEGLNKIKEQNLFREFCPLMVANACDILEEILKEENLP